MGVLRRVEAVGRVRSGGYERGKIVAVVESGLNRIPEPRY